MLWHGAEFGSNSKEPGRETASGSSELQCGCWLLLNQAIANGEAGSAEQVILAQQHPAQTIAGPI